MKIQFIQWTVLLGIACACVCAHAGALDNVIIDEYGNGTWVDTDNVTHSFSGHFIADPSGGTASALVYAATPFTFSVQGDYKLYSPETSELVGVIRFYGNNTIIFYDNDTGPSPSLADGSGMPANVMPFLLSLNQTLVGDPISQTVVTPNSGMAGYDNGTRQYTFLSVLPVPEPGVLALLACSVALLAVRRRRPNG